MATGQVMPGNNFSLLQIRRQESIYSYSGHGRVEITSARRVSEKLSGTTAKRNI